MDVEHSPFWIFLKTERSMFNVWVMYLLLSMDETCFCCCCYCPMRSNSCRPVNFMRKVNLISFSFMIYFPILKCLLFIWRTEVTNSVKHVRYPSFSIVCKVICLISLTTANVIVILLDKSFSLTFLISKQTDKQINK